jgi:GT2 family glycosyltransferase
MIPEMQTMASPDLVSILIPCCGQLEFTRLCIPSLLRHTRSPFELIFLDIASLDGTREYLAGFRAGTSVPVEVVRTMTDMGIPAACEEAVRRARGEFLVLLNNDTLVTEHWLGQLIGLAQLSPTIAMVGPMSNAAASPQLVEAVPYRLGVKAISRRSMDVSFEDAQVDVAPMEAFARAWHEENRGKWLEVDYLGGFCLLLKRQLLDQIGPLEAKAGLNIFDTDALCLKIRKAGYSLACCKDLFIHNFASRG